MGIERIEVRVGGKIFTAWENVTVKAGFDEACRGFSLKAANELGASATHALFALGAAVQILANDDLLLDGYVTRRRPRFDSDSSSIAIIGKSKAVDLIECSTVHDTGDFTGMDPVQIGNAISAGIAARFETDQQLEKIARWHLSQGKRIHACVEEMCREQSMTLTGTAEGNVKITKAGTARHAGGLYEGENLLSAEADHDASNRHSRIIVRGQRAVGHGPDALEIEAVAQDARVKRYRPLIILQKDDTSKARAKDRAENRRNRAAGNALRTDAEVQGFRDDAGAIWEPGRLIWTESETLGYAQDMLIESAEFQQDGKNGSTCSLGLVDPRAYDGAKGKGNRSSDEYDLDDSDAE